MKRAFLIFLLTPLGLTALAQTSDLPVAVPVSLHNLAFKNIFDPSRAGKARYGSTKPKAPVVRAFTFRGTIDETAFFTGDGVPSKGYLMAGDLINGYKVMQITRHFVKLADPSGQLMVLKLDDTMRREDEGPWTMSDQPAPATVASSGSVSTPGPGPSASTSSGGGSESDILKRLKARREQEEK